MDDGHLEEADVGSAKLLEADGHALAPGRTSGSRPRRLRRADQGRGRIRVTFTVDGVVLVEFTLSLAGSRRIRNN